jgi:hypothetical protein
MQLGTREDNSAIQMQAAMVISALNEGYYVSVADDGGPKAAFCKSWFRICKGLYLTNYSGWSRECISFFGQHSSSEAVRQFHRSLFQPHYHHVWVLFCRHCYGMGKLYWKL